MLRVAVGMFINVLLASAVVTGQAQNAPDGQYRPSVWRDNYSSQRIEALRQRLASGDRTTDAFWAEIAQVGTPLIEPSQPDDKHQLVTFLWRGTAQTQNVLVVWSPFTGVRPQDYLMRRLENSDVWYLVVRVLRGARFLYQLAPNAPYAFWRSGSRRHRGRSKLTR